MGHCLAKGVAVEELLSEYFHFFQSGHSYAIKPPNVDDDDHHVDFSGGNVNLVTTEAIWHQKLSEAKGQGKIVVANFTATWCDPCRVIAPLFCELSESHPSLMFLTVDVDELTDFSSSWDIKATPTFYFLRDGHQMDKIVGANKQELHEKVIRFSDSAAPSQAAQLL